MLCETVMDGISLDGIMGILRPILPTLSYFINLATKMFDLFTSYLGIEIVVPEEESSSTQEDTSI